MTRSAPNERRLLRRRQQANKLGIGLTKLWLIEKSDPTFPRPIRIGPRSVGRFDDELDSWLDSRKVA